jgi:hypothetical protein
VKWKLALLVSALLLLWFRHAWPGFLTANESIRYSQIVAWVEDHTVAIDHPLAFYHSRNVDRAERAGHAYSHKPPGGHCWPCRDTPCGRAWSIAPCRGRRRYRSIGCSAG